MTALTSLLDVFRNQSKSEREKGTYFEELILTYFKNEATYAELYSDVWTYGDWAKQQGKDAKDTGIDLVAKTRGTEEYHAIQCKFYDESYRLQKSDIDSFFTASGQKPFTHRIIVSTTNHWSEHAEAALIDQQPPVTKIDFEALENSKIDWARYKPGKEVKLKEKKKLRPHQETALVKVKAGLKDAERGKLIMACGTGKTFTSLKIAEEIAGKGGKVLFLVPSLSLLSQSLTEWTQESDIPLSSFAVCSDSDVGKKRKKDDDVVQTFTHELNYPATTNAKHLAKAIEKRADKKHMTVVFSTYHSIDVISEAQKKYQLEEFDLIICDEAHRTTGATFANEDESHFVKVHDAKFIRSRKRIYMTATPRIFGDTAKATAEIEDVTLCSMNDEKLYGKDLHVITFSEAVKRGLLTDYKVIVLTVDEAHISKRLQSLLKDENNSLKVDDAAKIVGCWKALSKHNMADDTEPMKRAVAFCQVIEASLGAKTHKVSSKQIAGMFSAVVEAYQAQEDDHGTLICEAEHVDGSMNASEKESKLNWLKAEPAENTCRILSNVRCLSEGVDVPALDAVLFLTPRNSQVDVVQSVGRVMRNAPGKKRGYVVLPVVIPAGMEPHEALNDNKVYKVVWEVLQALRSHDDRFDAMVNKLDLIGKDNNKMEVIAVTDTLPKKAEKQLDKKAKDKALAKNRTIGENIQSQPTPENYELEFEVGEIERALYAKVVQKCGNRHHWEDWANDIADIARKHIVRITTIVENPDNKKERKAFEAFANELRDDLNDSISDGEIIEMLAQHMVTKPVFDALFEGYSFAKQNPMSQAIQGVLNVLEQHHINKEADTLEQFYASVKLRAEGIDNAAGKQKIVVELYDKFFRNAFPRMADRLGIVYTPVEVVDFIIHSVNHILQTEFNQTLGSKDVHIIDPFTGTGTFITRLLQSGLITPKELPNKYQYEIHANEIVLLAYYIAAINIEAVYHSIVGGEYQPFEGICLTDTFQMYEKEDMIDQILVKNSARRKRQKKLDIRVIVGNPPYSSGQNSANDNNQNVAYPHLDERIRNTYAERSVAINKNALYDSYIRAISWASDRIGNVGVIGFVSGSGFVEKPAMSGLRKCLAEEFSNIHVLNLRGDIRKNMLSKGRAKEGQNIFGSGSMTGIAITLFVKNPEAKQHGQIFYHDIGDDLTKSEKLDAIRSYVSMSGITDANGWQVIRTDSHGDWLSQRDDNFAKFVVLGDKKSSKLGLFHNFSRGLETNRDAWCYNSCKKNVTDNMSLMIKFYNSEVKRFSRLHAGLSKKERESKVDNFIDTDSRKISWNRSLKQHLVNERLFSFDATSLITSLYRPFTKQQAYYHRELNAYVNQMPRIFPNSTTENLVICVSGVGARSGFSSLITKCLPDLHTLDTGQCFPLYLYESAGDEDKIDFVGTGDMFAAKKDKPTAGKGSYTRKDAITDSGLNHFKIAYPGEKISKEDIFYYVYGLLHSPDYRERYADNLSKELPRIPCVKLAKDFWHFSKAGRDLAELHLNYETVKPYPVKIEVTGKNKLTDDDYRVEKMKYEKSGKEKDLSTLHYNHRIKLTGIPLEAYDYVVNGKPALDWVVERQCVKTDKDSGIVNDANDWATETMKNPKYPLELFQRVITVSLETMKIVNGLPKLDIC